ncbi:MAG: hypothetical protein QGH15_20120 [Kiritimatiellia bacterium]|jgi:hypothetical protein|nr:hypothetical protein [Kiritimatiellia bacterium]
MNYFFRHPVECTKNPRKAYATVKAMREYRVANPVCSWCGKGKIHVHHVEPIQFAPERAADPGNFISLCGKRCHLAVGHAGNWKQFVENVVQICAMGVCIRAIKRGN